MKPVSVGASSAQRYYYEKDPIFNENGEGQNIEFQGALAETLGLHGFASKEEFKNILQGKDPQSGTQLVGDGGNENKRAALDLPFSAPKSVSHAALVLGEEKALEAHDKAVEKAISFIEDNYAKTRGYEKDENGENQRVEIKTGNLAVAKVRHSTARPVEGQMPDPSLHTHSLVMNMTYDSKNDKFKALDNEDIFKNQKLIQEVYKSELAKELTKSGYVLDFKENGNFEIAGYDQDILNNFSKRHMEVMKEKEAMKEQGFSGSEGLLDEISQHNSKSEKIEVTKEDLVMDWVAQHEKNNLRDIDSLRKGIYEQEKRSFNMTASKVLEVAAQNLHSNEAVFSKENLLKEAMKVGRGKYGIDDYTKELDQVKKIGQTYSDALVKLDDDKFTTKGMKDIERENASIIKNQKDFGALMGVEEANMAIAKFEDEKKWKMTEGQRNAVRELLTSGDQFIAIQGDAGVGKTTLLEAFRIANEIHDTNANLQILAPTGKAASEAYEASAIEASTVDLFLIKNKNTDLGKKVEEVSQKMEKMILERKALSDLYLPKEKQQEFKEVNEAFKKRSMKHTNPPNVTTGRNFYQIDKFETLTKGKHAGATRKSTFQVKGDNFKSKTVTTLNDGTKLESVRKEWNPLKASRLKGFGMSSLLSVSNYKNVEKEKGNRFIDFVKSDKSIGGRLKDLFDKDKYTKTKGSGFAIKIAGFSISSDYKEQTKDGETRKLKKHEEKIHKDSGKRNFRIGFLGQSVFKYVKGSSTKTLTGETKKGKKWELEVENKIKGFTILGTGVKTKIETVRDKDGNILSHKAVKEKSFLGYTIGKMTVMDQGIVVENNFTRLGKGILKQESKVVGEYSKGNADKVASFVNDNVKIVNGEKILIIDESSMLSGIKGNDLLKYAKENGVRLIFMGDSKQLQSIEAGRFFDQLKELTKTIEVTESVRQRGNKEAKEMVDKVASKDILGGLESLEKGKGGKIVQSENFKDRVATAAKAVLSNEKETLVVAGTRKEVSEVNSSVRATKYGDRNFGDSYEVKVGRNLSAFKRQTADSYRVGDIVTPNTSIKGMDDFFKYLEFSITEKDTKKNELTLKLIGGDLTLKVDLAEHGRHFSVKELQQKNFAEGDKIVFLKNDRDLKVFNGELGFITKIEGNNFTIQKENKKEVTIDISKYKDLDHGYAVTVNKSQGTTAKNVVAMFSAQNDSMNNYNFSYVALSRHKESVTLVADDYNKLKKQVINEQFKTSSLDFPKEAGNKDYFNTGKKDPGSFKVEKSEVDIRDQVKDLQKVERAGLVNEGKVQRETENFRKERDQADPSSKEFREAQRGFMDGQAVQRNGVRVEDLEKFAKYAVDKKIMSPENARQFIENTLTNASNLEKAGILKGDGQGNYTFIDEKAREILSNNLGKDYKVIAKENLEAYGVSEKVHEVKVSKDIDKAVKEYSDKYNEVVSNGFSDRSSQEAKEAFAESKENSKKFNEKEFEEKLAKINPEAAESFRQEREAEKIIEGLEK